MPSVLSLIAAGPIPCLRRFQPILSKRFDHCRAQYVDAGRQQFDGRTEDGSLGKGVEDVTIDRNEDNDSSRLVASHDGYVRSFGLTHERSVMLGNDGKGSARAGQADPQGPQETKERHFYRHSLSLGTWDRSGAHRRRNGGDPSFSGCAAMEFSVQGRDARDRKKAFPSTPTGNQYGTIQLVIVGETSAIGTTIAWQFRRSS